MAYFFIFPLPSAGADAYIGPPGLIPHLLLTVSLRSRRVRRLWQSVLLWICTGVLRMTLLQRDRIIAPTKFYRKALRRGGVLPRPRATARVAPTEMLVGADDPVRPGPITQHLVGQGPRALPGVRWGIGGGVRAPRPTECLPIGFRRGRRPRRPASFTREAVDDRRRAACPAMAKFSALFLLCGDPYFSANLTNTAREASGKIYAFV